jgi:hypothetical protein
MPEITIQENGCWLWSGRTDPYKHPITTLPPGHPQAGRTVRVKHINFEAQYGYKPKQIENSCGSSLCVNPEHLVDKLKRVAESRKREKIAKLLPQILWLQGMISAAEDANIIDPEVLAILKQNKEKLTKLLALKESIEQNKETSGE